MSEWLQGEGEGEQYADTSTTHVHQFPKKNSYINHHILNHNNLKETKMNNLVNNFLTSFFPSILDKFKWLSNFQNLMSLLIFHMLSVES